MPANSIVLQGSVVRDPELRYTTSGKAVCEITVANNDKRDGKDNTLFLPVTFWEKRAEFVAEYFHKGDQIVIEGRLVQESYEKDGQKRTVIKAVGNQAHFCGGNSGHNSKQSESICSNGIRNDQPEDGDIPF